MVLALTLTACTASDPLAKQAAAGGNKNYIAGDGSVSEYAEENRGEPVEFSSKLYDGTVVDSSDWAGQVTVLNFWYAACPPCRAEAPELQALYEKYKDEGVMFYGVNVRDPEPTAAAFERNFGVTYPSFDDRDGEVLFAMTQYVPPQAVPTTIVLDKQGRVAARIIGLAEKSTLDALISDAVAG
ncbi:TlpA family protein disulfide reductase [Arthrobacter castelli]|uniref:TlpA family protein disulfide reductase n=1 Tax=Arthrobacter castelli TaxID=271431 RepID=UPI00042716B0|nr:TlpA disulfide reductase family protein [Arthrobacter castelli]